MTSALPGCGNFIWRLRNVVPEAEPDEFPGPAHQAPGHRADDARLHRAGRSEAARRRAGKTAAAAVGGRIGERRNRSLSSAGCRARRKECKATPDGQAARAGRQAPARRKARHAVQGAKSLPWCRSASTATSAGCLPIAIPEVADPSPVLPGPLQSATRKPPARSRFRNQTTLPRRKSDRCDLLHRSHERCVLDLRHGRENLPSVVRYRHQDRLRLDRGRRGRCRVRVHLPDPGLINA